MARYNNVIEGLQLLASCEPKGAATFGVDAEHDIIYAGPEISECSEQVNEQMEKLGWHRSDADRWAIYT